MAGDGVGEEGSWDVEEEGQLAAFSDSLGSRFSLLHLAPASLLVKIEGLRCY